LNTLLIVDIQKSMGMWFTWTYINKVDRFLRLNSKNYDQVLMVMEPHFARSSEPRMLKSCSGDYNYGSDEIPSFLLKYLSATPFYKAYNKDFWEEEQKCNNCNQGTLVQLTPEYEHDKGYPIYLNHGLRELLSSLSGSINVDIIGGGITKCVALTSRLLNLYDIPNIVLEEVCYAIRFVNTNRRDENTFSTKPIQSIPKRILGVNGKLEMTEIGLTFKP
jgi:hypothetical protein